MLKISPYYLQSNRRTEAAIKSMKQIIRTAWNGRYMNEGKLCRALLQYRNMPSRKDGLSPAQNCMVPHSGYAACSSQFLCPGVATQCPGSNTTDRGYTGSKSKVLQHSSTSLTEIQVGTNVAVQDIKTRIWDTYCSHCYMPSAPISC